MRLLVKSFNPALYFILDPACCAGRDVVDVALRAVSGGVTMIQYRDKINPPDLILKNAVTLKAALRGSGVPLLINDYVDIAHESGADGAHIGQGDISPGAARTILGDQAILGLTAFTQDHIAEVDAELVDYIGTGPVYPTQTDKGKPVLGVEKFAGLVKLSPVPVVGIGGVTAVNSDPVLQAGAAGVAVMRAIGEAADVCAAAAAFNQNIPRLRSA